jgi:hypothetical protein
VGEGEQTVTYHTAADQEAKCWLNGHIIRLHAHLILNRSASHNVVSSVPAIEHCCFADSTTPKKQTIKKAARGWNDSLTKIPRGVEDDEQQHRQMGAMIRKARIGEGRFGLRETLFGSEVGRMGRSGSQTKKKP